MSAALKLVYPAPVADDGDEGTSQEFAGRLTTPSAIRAFVLAGNATLTLKSERSDKRYTFKVTRAKEARGSSAPPHFVGVMFGSDNENDYSFLGTLFDAGRTYRHSRKSAMAEGDVRERAFLFMWQRVVRDVMPPEMQVWHEGACGRCGRKLTVPESVARGFGPICQRTIDGE